MFDTSINQQHKNIDVSHRLNVQVDKVGAWFAGFRSTLTYW